MIHEPFGFTIWYWAARDAQPEHWTISLPHQCGDWNITDDLDGAPNRDVAVYKLRLFIAEANRALTHLESVSEHSSESWQWEASDG